MSPHARAWRMLAGPDTPTRRGLPASELLAPLPLLALVVLGLNDWVLKGSAAPAWLTGKLSDFAGLFVSPLVVTAALDLVLLAMARLGVPVDFTLRRWKLAAAIAAIGVVFTAMKLSPDVAGWISGALSAVVAPSRVLPDPTDVVAVLMLAGTWWHGRRAIARIPHGRLELAARRYARGRPRVATFSDALACGAEPALVRDLDAASTAWLAGGDAAAVESSLARLRGAP